MRTALVYFVCVFVGGGGDQGVLSAVIPVFTADLFCSRYFWSRVCCQIVSLYVDSTHLKTYSLCVVSRLLAYDVPHTGFKVHTKRATSWIPHRSRKRAQRVAGVSYTVLLHPFLLTFIFFWLPVFEAVFVVVPLVIPRVVGKLFASYYMSYIQGVCFGWVRCGCFVFLFGLEHTYSLMML